MTTKQERREAVERGEWLQRDGAPILISEMGDGHLLRAAAMMRRKGFIGLRELAAFFSHRPNGEMALLAFEAEMDDAFSRPAHPYVDLLNDEIKKRGLE
jgi:hypothetical protein